MYNSILQLNHQKLESNQYNIVIYMLDQWICFAEYFKPGPKETILLPWGAIYYFREHL